LYLNNSIICISAK